jgi:hypothetical protein
MKAYMGDVNRSILNYIKPYVLHHLKIVSKPNNYQWPKHDLLQKLLLICDNETSVCLDVLRAICKYTLCTALKYMQSLHYRYRVMTNCWEKVASERPTFKELTEPFEQMLQDDLEYLDLNPGIVHNRTYCASPRDILGKYIGYPRRKCTSWVRCLIN